MNAWIECPNCRGVLKATSAQMEGPCVFCQAQLRVSFQVSAVAAEAPRQKEANVETRPRHLAGRGPMPIMRPLVKVRA